MRDFKAACEEARKDENAEEVIVLSEGQSGLWKNEDGLPEAKIHESFLPGQPEVGVKTAKSALSDEPTLSPEIKRQLCELERKEIDINELIQSALDERIAKLEQKKTAIAANLHEATSRHTPAATMQVIKEEFGTKCAVPNCNKKSTQIHHANRYSISKNHNPYFMAPLCNEHHQIAHSVDIKSLEARARKFIQQS